MRTARPRRSRPCSSRRTCPNPYGTWRATRSGCSPRRKARCTASTPTRSSSTRSVRWTRSSTSSASPPRSTHSASNAIVAGPVGPGQGVVERRPRRSAQPAPAVARLLAQRSMPTIGIDTGMELATPTGVALLAALAASFGPMPAMTVTGVGYGAGHRRPGRAPERRPGHHRRGDRGETLLPQPGRRAALARRQRRRRHRRGARPRDRAACSPPALTTRG